MPRPEDTRFTIRSQRPLASGATQRRSPALHRGRSGPDRNPDGPKGSPRGDAMRRILRHGPALVRPVGYPPTGSPFSPRGSLFLSRGSLATALALTLFVATAAPTLSVATATA